MDYQIQRPLLAATLKNLLHLRYPVACTPKIDGIRCLLVNGCAVSRTFKPIRNNFIRTQLEQTLPNGADGEIIVGKTFQQTSSAVMSADGSPEFIFYWFDWYQLPGEHYLQRLSCMAEHNWSKPPEFKINKLYPTIVRNETELLDYEEFCLVHHYEGIMIRNPIGPYKFGRSTLHEGTLIKMKRFADSEAVILSCHEKLHNFNEPSVDAFGNTKRSTHQDNKLGMDTLGSVTVRDLKTNVVFDLAVGGGDENQKKLWQDRDSLPGKLVKYKYFPIGVDVKPRFPIWIGLYELSI